MIDPLSNVLTVAPPSGATPNTVLTAANGPSTPPAGNAAPSATRIFVDRGSDGVYVYRLVDTVTGRILAELPRSASGSAKVSEDYAPGAVASASA